VVVYTHACRVFTFTGSYASVALTNSEADENFTVLRLPSQSTTANDFCSMTFDYVVFKAKSYTNQDNQSKFFSKCVLASGDDLNEPFYFAERYLYLQYKL